MQIILNEISLEKKFFSFDDFLDKLLEILKIYKVKTAEIEIYKHSSMLDTILFNDVKFSDVLTKRTYAIHDEIRKYRRVIDQTIIQEPFWDFDKKHKSTDSYKIDFTNKLYDYGIAEAYEREKVVLSFRCEEFDNCNSISIIKNDDQKVEIFNIYSEKCLVEFMKLNSLMSLNDYCNYKYRVTNLSFDDIDVNESFNILTNEETEIFLEAFDQFSSMSWSQIIQSDGLCYKKYSPSNKKKSWFKGTRFEDKNIYKFRVNQKFRCFGYREEDIFYVVRFEVNHKFSDNG